MVSRQNTLAVEMRVIGELKKLRIHVFTVAFEFNHAHAGVTDIEGRAKDGVGNIQKTAEKCQAEALMRKERNALIVIVYYAIAVLVTQMLVS